MNDAGLDIRSNAAAGNILLVDDEPAIRRSLYALLTGEGWAVSMASDGESALELLDRESPDVVLTDIRMPGMDGIALLERIKQRTPDMPVLLMSAYADLETLILAVRERAHDFIIKPFAPDMIISAMRKSLEYKRLLDMEKDYRELLEETVVRNAGELRQYMHELRETRDAALAASRAKTTFLAGISHEIRTPLNGIVGIIDLLMHKEQLPHQKEYLSMMKEASDYLATLLGSILDYSRLASGKMEFVERPFGLRGVLDSVCRMMLAKTMKKGLQLTVTVDPDLHDSLAGDDIRLSQVLLNLLDNGVKFTEKGTVALRCRTANPSGAGDGRTIRLLFSVADTGCGVSPELAERIFDSFSQPDCGLTRKHAGAGLGLAIVKEIVEQMGGSVWMESVPDCGSTFFCEIAFKTGGETDAHSHCRR